MFDIFLTLLAATAFVLALFWIVAKISGYFPRALRSETYEIDSSVRLTTRKADRRIIFLIAAIAAVVFWLLHLEALLESQFLTIAFFTNLAWVILVPVLALYWRQEIRGTVLGETTETPGDPYAQKIQYLSDDIRAMADAGDKLGACKRYKEEAAVSLMEAKKTVEAYLNSPEIADESSDAPVDSR